MTDVAVVPSAALLTVRLWRTLSGEVVARIMSVETLDAGDESVETSADIDAVRRHVDAWLVGTVARLASDAG